jgi:hypothetical protein
MNIPNVVIVVSINQNFKPFLKLFNLALNDSGVRFELYVITELEKEEISFLKAKKIFHQKNTLGSEYLNEIITNQSNYFVFISEPFLVEKNWLKKMINFKQKLLNCGSCILPFHSHIDNLELNLVLNNDYELSSVYTQKEDGYCGITLFGQEVINAIGGFNCELDFNNAILEYTLRSKKKGFQNFVCFEFATNIFNKKKLFYNKNITVIERPIREFTTIEEIAYNNLDNLFATENIEAEKFMFDFTATLGFRCVSLDVKQINSIINFGNQHNLQFTIKSNFLSTEQRLNKNIYLFFNLID